MNAIGAIINKLLTVSLFDSNGDSEVFYTWLEKDLIPKLPEESVIVMDNATFHKRLDMKEIIQSNNHTLLSLPPYSPDLNPIEHKWSEAKSIRRKERCSVDELFTKLIPKQSKNDKINIEDAVKRFIFTEKF
jgi:transposase